MFQQNKIGEDENDPLLMCFSILKAVGCWGVESNVTWIRVLYKLYQYFVLTGFTIIAILQIACIVNARDDIEIFNYTLVSSSGTIMLIFVMCALLPNRMWLSELQRDVSNCFYLSFVGKSKDDRKIISGYDDSSWKILKIYYLFLALPAVTMWCMLPAIDGTENERILPMTMWLPFDYQVTPIYEILWAFQCCMLYMYILAIVAIDQVFFCYLSRFCAQFDILKKNLRLTHRYEDEELYHSQRYEAAIHKVLVQTAIHHDALLIQCRKMDSIYRKIIYIQFFGISVVMCSTIFDVALTPKSMITLRFLQQIQYFAAAIVATYMVCYFGNRLIVRVSVLVMQYGEEFSKELYAIPWYHMSRRCKKLLLHVQVNARKPVAMSGGGRFYVNNELFLTVCKLSYKILAVLKHMQNSKR